MTSRLASVTFKMASKVFIEETDKNFDFKNGTKKQKAASPGVEPGLSARARNPLTNAPQ